MTNSLIPYSFIPGTKAKAQEINDNFIALANQITENKEYTDTKIDDVRSSITNDRAGTKLENTDLISNCVLDAPNGIVTYTGNTITVKNGLKVLIPDGRKDDGSLKSIEHTVEEDVLLTTTNNTTINAVYIAEDSISTAEIYQYGNITPVYSGGIWYNIEENKTYKYSSDSSSWEEFPCCVVAVYENTSDTVVNVKKVYPVGLLKENDIPTIIMYGLPDYQQAVSKTATANHTAPVNGYVFCAAETQQNNGKYLNIDSTGFMIGHHITGQHGWSSIMMPISKGSSYNVYNADTNTRLSFIPGKGGF